MNSLKTLYFPATDIYSIRQYPIFLLSQNIHIIQPVEKDPTSPDSESTDTFIKSGFCQVDTPCPLGPDRNRFLHLVRDIETRKDDYAGQLGTITLAGMSQFENPSESSERAIMNELLPPEDLKKDALEQQHEAKLWQARLVLAIGEILDREEEEIAAKLATLNDETTILFRDLQGESDELDDLRLGEALNQIERTLGSTNPKTMKKRLLAWKTLFQQSSLTDSALFLTTSPDAGDYLINNYEKLQDKPVLIFEGFALPGLIATEGDIALSRVKDFTDANKDLLHSLQQKFEELRNAPAVADTPGVLGDLLEPAAEQWREAVEQAFPNEEHGRLAANICVFPETPCSALLETDAPGESKNGLALIVG